MPPRRVVSLVPSTTETVCELGAGDRLVGVTRWCTEPAAALAHLPRIGGTKNPDREAVAALAPDLVLCNREENRIEDIEWFGARFPLFDHTPCSVAAAAASVRALAERLDVADASSPILLHLEAELARAAVDDVRLHRVAVFYAIWCKPWMGVGRDTYVHDLLLRCGADDVGAASPGRYPELDPDQVRARGAQLVLLSSEPFPFTEQHRRQFVAQQLFGPDVPVLLCDGRDFCWHGAHTPHGIGRALDLLRPFRATR